MEHAAKEALQNRRVSVKVMAYKQTQRESASLARASVGSGSAESSSGFENVEAILALARERRRSGLQPSASVEDGDDVKMTQKI
jgi:hypothetical protein